MPPASRTELPQPQAKVPVSQELPCPTSLGKSPRRPMVPSHSPAKLGEHSGPTRLRREERADARKGLRAHQTWSAPERSLLKCFPQEERLSAALKIRYPTSRGKNPRRPMV